ncbi:VOC family protein [Nocardioides sp. ChNu-99]|uniref:VOC family protein n=1 Tax=Nocardioides sp. ChNu-99 TaxID=2839897 RepID=UPI0024074AD1|nr:VOC family protein [Nocardioides sp. ChNu-99]MDF9717294.1 VOC family protein [Nocardioides sp. ChNu-99]
MATHMNTYLVFGGNTREAMEFYRSVLGGRLDVMTFGDMGETGPVPPPEGVMHSFLLTDHGFRLMASDGPPAEEIVHGNDFAVALNGDAEDEAVLRGWYDAFAAAGTVDVPLEKQVWGDWFGQVTDPFGIAWMFNIASGEEPGGA